MARIVAGAARGRRLAEAPEGTRPTADRAKEGLFSSLESRFGVEGRHVLDLYAGSGALGLEALSRGAAEAVLVDSSGAACSVARTNAKAVGLPGALVEQEDVFAYLRRAPRGRFDMVLADPPYDVRASTVRKVLAALEPVLADVAVVAVERRAADEETTWPEGFTPTGQKLKKRTYGIARMDVAVFERAAARHTGD